MWGQFATIAYEDTNNDGFFNLIRYDLDGDTTYEISINLTDYNIKTSYQLFETGTKTPSDVNNLFEESAYKIWAQAMKAVEAAKSNSINYKWYSHWLNPKSLEEKYRFGYWVQFYLFFDFCKKADIDKNETLKTKAIKAYLTKIKRSRLHTRNISIPGISGKRFNLPTGEWTLGLFHAR